MERRKTSRLTGLTSHVGVVLLLKPLPFKAAFTGVLCYSKVDTLLEEKRKVEDCVYDHRYTLPSGVYTVLIQEDRRGLGEKKMRH